MDRDEAEKITNDSELLAGKLYIAQGNSIYPYEELGEASKELFRPLARYVIELLAALTAQGQEVDLHERIMNIKEDCPKDINSQRELWAFKLGHKQARLAAAEIVAGTWRKVGP